MYVQEKPFCDASGCYCDRHLCAWWQGVGLCLQLICVLLSSSAEAQTLQLYVDMGLLGVSYGKVR